MSWNRRILLIDDTPAIHDDFRKILGGEPSAAGLDELEAALFGSRPRAATVRFELDSAFQGEEGLAKVQASLAKGLPYAMAFVDMRMPPGWDGVETIERLWEADPELQVVICTAYSDYSWEEVLERLDVGDRLLVLKKPFDAIEVCQLANTLTAKWEMTRQAELKMAALEEAVRTRTAELARANEALQADIIKRARAEREAMEAYRRISDILEFLPDATFVVDAGGRVIAWNRAMEELSGTRKEDVLGQGDYVYTLPFHGQRRKALIDMLSDGVPLNETLYHGVRREGQTLSAEVRVMLRGQLRWLWNAATPLYDMQGARAGGVQTIRDVTELRRGEQERSRLEAQLQLSGAMESLMTRLGHDLKTPLTPLFALLPMIGKKVTDPAVGRMLDICQKSVSQIDALSSKALELMRLSCGQDTLEATPVPLRGAVQLCIDRCRSLFARRGVTCTNEVDEKVVVLATAEQLNQVLDNLLSNAARYAKEKVRVHSTLEGESAVISVEDDGAGLEPGQSTRIFEEFFKADTSRHDLDTQGLGLAICKRIISNHNGRIWAESPGPGQGTTVTFTLDLYKEPLKRGEDRA